MRPQIGICIITLALAACSSPTPSPKGTPVTIDQGGTVTSAGNGTLTIDPHALDTNVNVSLNPVPTPPAPDAIKAEPISMEARVSGFDLGALKKESVLNCKIRLKLNIPASNQNPQNLRMYQIKDATNRIWEMVYPYEVRANEGVIEACLRDLKDRDTYTLGTPKNIDTRIAAREGGTLQASPINAGKLVVKPGVLQTDALVNLNQVVPPRGMTSSDKVVSALLLESKMASTQGIKKAALDCGLQLTMTVPAGTQNPESLHMYHVNGTSWTEVIPSSMGTEGVTGCIEGLGSSDLYVLATPVLQVNFTNAPSQLKVNSTFELKALAQFFQGPGLPGKTFTWTSSNPQVAEIKAGTNYGSALVTVKNFGTVKFTATVDGKSATTGNINTYGLLVSGGTSQDVVQNPQSQQLFEFFGTALRVKYVPQTSSIRQQASLGISVQGPSGWNGNNPYTFAWAPNDTHDLISVFTAPVTGKYSYAFNDGIETHGGTFDVDASQKLARPTGLAVKGGTSGSNMNLQVSWLAPAGAHLASQEVGVFDLSHFNGLPLASVKGISPQVLQFPYQPKSFYAACAFSRSQDPDTTDFTQQVNESAACFPFQAP